ncbi:hypothetical protein ISCGN_030009 [Ixodes scapularis]
MDSLSGKRMYSLLFASLALCTGKLQAALAEDFATLYAAAVSQPKSRCHADKAPFCMDAPFTESELRSALRASKRRGALGPDGVRTQMLQNLPDSRLQELLSSFNDIWASSEFPAVWRLAWVVPVLKSGKPAGDLSSYRPVSLTSCVAKLFERLVHARLIWWLEEQNLLPSNITGFRSRLSAQDSILVIVSAVHHAAASRKSTVAAFFDIQAAFDNVEPASVLAQLTSWGITGRVQGFLEGFLSNRSIQVKLSNTLSQSRPVQRGLPQGSVLSPLLFNIAIAGLPAALPNSRIPIGISMYVDDLCIWVFPEAMLRVGEEVAGIQEVNQVLVGDVLEDLAGDGALVTNFRQESQHLTKGTAVGYVEEIQDSAAIAVISEDASPTHHKGTTPSKLDIDPSLPGPQRRQLTDLLAEFKGKKSRRNATIVGVPAKENKEMKMKQAKVSVETAREVSSDKTLRNKAERERRLREKNSNNTKKFIEERKSAALKQSKERERLKKIHEKQLHDLQREIDNGLELYNAAETEYKLCAKLECFV